MNNLFIVAGVLAVIALGVIGFQHFRIGHLDTQLAAVNAQLEVLTAANQSFAKQVTTQNSAISALEAQRRAQEQKAQAALAQAENTALLYATASQKLETIKRTGNECADTFAYIDSYYEGL